MARDDLTRLSAAPRCSLALLVSSMWLPAGEQPHQDDLPTDHAAEQVAQLLDGNVSVE